MTSRWMVCEFALVVPSVGCSEETTATGGDGGAGGDGGTTGVGGVATWERL